jgi:hypothetical protein
LACIKGHIRQVQFCIFMTTVEGSLEPLCCLTHSIIEAHRRRGVTKRSRSLASVSSRPLVIGLAAPVPRPCPAPSHAHVQLPSPALEMGGRRGEGVGDGNCSPLATCVQGTRCKKRGQVRRPLARAADGPGRQSASHATGTWGRCECSIKSQDCAQQPQLV